MANAEEKNKAGGYCLAPPGPQGSLAPTCCKAPRLVPLGVRPALRLRLHHRAIPFLLFLCPCPECRKLPGQPSPASPQSLFPKGVVPLMSALNLVKPISTMM